ncbi:hypothetical protein ERO13_D12G142200v2 [Gossypium hirsutum]|nr:hypothetical protein ERO13_D12G142200v2 [Gossypium hirsutum]
MAFRFCIKIMQGQENHLEPLDFEISHHFFHINVEFRYISSHDPQITLETRNRSILCRRDLFFSEQNGRNILIAMVADFGASQDFIDTVLVPDVMSFAWDTHSMPMNLGRQVIKLRVELVIEVRPNDEIEESLTSSVNFKPASKSSIEALKRVIWDDDELDHIPLKKRRKLAKGLSSRKECVVCLEEFLDGDEVASLPCGHVYHYGCIVKWLETSHLCPLCRYHMPID